MNELGKEREQLITDMVLYCAFSEHLEKVYISRNKRVIFFDMEEIEFVIKQIGED